MAHLRDLASEWATANGRSLARLATLVANDGKLFDRLATGAGCTIATYERFMRFFADPANWPGDAHSPAVEQKLRAAGAIE
jgi:hypothetical protein